MEVDESTVEKMSGGGSTQNQKEFQENMW